MILLLLAPSVGVLLLLLLGLLPWSPLLAAPLLLRFEPWPVVWLGLVAAWWLGCWARWPLGEGR